MSQGGVQMSNDSTESTSSADSLKQAMVLKYVLITPARNEAASIELTLKSMVEQEVAPVKWVIVSDGSTDGTDDIVKKYTAEYDWIELVRMPERSERHFAGKVWAFNSGYARVRNLKYDVIGNLDADISLGPDHFQFLLAKFAEHPLLGVAGTAYVEESSVPYDYDIVNVEDVSGACQLFRRKCFDEIGGYIPIKGGGIDSIAVFTARMKGWKTRTFTEKTFIHHRRGGTGQSKISASLFRTGKIDYYYGGHPLWEIFRCLYQMKNKPYIVRGLLLFSGYMWLFLKKAERPISDELVEFLRKEQIQRLKAILKRLITFKRASTTADRSSIDSMDMQR
jgi:glycosyltransferase involved in cell wall biosynthesis